MYSVRGRTAATAATADHAVFGIWNPHSTQRVKVISYSIIQQTAGVAGSAFRFRRISARGTAGSTVTPGITNDHRNAIAPPSGILLDLAAYSAQPTLTGVDLGIGWLFSTIVASGMVYPFPGGLELGPGTGIAFIQVAAAAAPIYEVTVSWLEDY